MKGLDYILDEIRQQGENRAAEITAEYDEKIAAWEAEFGKQAEAEAAQRKRSYEQAEKLAYEKALSQAQMAKKTALLEGKRAILENSLERVREYLAKQPVEAYAAFVTELVRRRAGAGNGSLIMTDEDRQVLGEAWLKELNESLSAEGKGRLVIDSERTLRAGEAGVIVNYADTEENCTLTGLFSEHRELLEDAAYTHLFA
ncbi:MAG: V-type ATP synthase subunit E [Eubacteriales bacterium]|nr:V-type ATP synthase subunit E [Eubacteriales bacterium]